MADLAFLSAVVYAIVYALKEQFGLQGHYTRLAAIALGLLIAFTAEVRMLTEYSVPYWVDAFFTGLAIGLGLPSVFHKATQAVSRVGEFASGSFIVGETETD
jgi:hypothetical protein